MMIKWLAKWFLIRRDWKDIRWFKFLCSTSHPWPCCFYGCLTWFYYLFRILYAFSLSLYIIIIRCNVNWQIGKAKVFLRAGQMAELDARRAEVLGNAARTIQRQIRTYIARKEFISLRKAAIQTQSHWRGIVFYCLQISALCQ